FALGVGAFGGIGSESTPLQESSLGWFGAEGIAELRTKLGDVTLRAGAGPRVLAIVQSLRRVDAERVELAGYDPERHFRGAAAGGHALVGARLAIGSRTWIELDARGDLLAVRLQGTVVAAWTAGLGAAIGMSF